MKKSSTHVFLSHGLESGPGSIKIQALKNLVGTFDNVRAYAIDHRSSKDPATRLAQMQDAIAATCAAPENIILAGSSMGGWADTCRLSTAGMMTLSPPCRLLSSPGSKRFRR